MNQWHFSPFARLAADNGRRRTPTARHSNRVRRGVAAILALTMLTLPVASAVAADRVLQLTPATAPAAIDGVSAYPGDTPASANPTSAPKMLPANSSSMASDPNLGSIQDYVAQQNDPPVPGYAAGAGRRHAERPASLTGDLYVGGLVVGLLALEIASQHRHH